MTVSKTKKQNTKKNQLSLLKKKFITHELAKSYKKNINSTQSKAMLLCKMIQDKKFSYVKQQLVQSNKKVAREVLSLLKTCEGSIPGEDFSNILVHTQVNKGYVIKRRRCRARGSSSPIRKAKSHIYISLIKKVRQTGGVVA